MPRDKQITLDKAVELFEKTGVAVRKVGASDWRDRSKNGVQYDWIRDKVDLCPSIARENPSLFIKAVRKSLKLAKERGKLFMGSILAILAIVSFFNSGNSAAPSAF